MNYVEIYRTTKNGQQLAGRIWCDGARVFADPPDSALLNSIIAHPLHLPGGVVLTAARDCVHWLGSLHVNYSGSMLRASEIRSQQTPAPV